MLSSTQAVVTQRMFSRTANLHREVTAVLGGQQLGPGQHGRQLYNHNPQSASDQPANHWSAQTQRKDDQTNPQPTPQPRC